MAVFDRMLEGLRDARRLASPYADAREDPDAGRREIAARLDGLIEEAGRGQGRAEKVAENVFEVTIPVGFTVIVDEGGHARSVVAAEPLNSGRRWIKGCRDGHGTAYPENPAGLLAKAARIARLAATEGQTDE